MNVQKTDRAVLAILREVQEAGLDRISRTALVKFCYLLDLYQAEETGGQTFTEAEWFFSHFGPFAADLADRIAILARDSRVVEDSRESRDNQFFLYSLPEWSNASGLADLGLDAHVRLGMTQCIRRYSRDLSALLEYVYFRTQPMEGALPGSRLSFASVIKPDWKRDFRPIPVHISDAKVKRLGALIDSIGRVGRARPVALQPPPIHDELYWEAIRGDTSDDGQQAVTVRATLTFD